MKIVFAFIFLLPGLSYGQAVDTVDVKALDFKAGLVHKSGKPYTGFGVASWGNGQKMAKGNYKNGKREGLWIQWWDNGQKRSEGKYMDGKMEGLWTEWHTNGQKETVGNLKDGWREGLWTEWHPNGQKKSEITYKDGEEESRKEWDENGNEIKN